MQRTVLERFAGSFQSLEEWGLQGFLFVVFAATIDVLLSGTDRYLESQFAFLIPGVLLGMCTAMFVVGIAGTGAVKFYCYWFNRPDPTEPVSVDDE